MTIEDERFTRSGVRLCCRKRRPGGVNWLLLPGGPGIGSESLLELADLLDVPGSVWLVDLPGDGSNVTPPGLEPGESPFARWPQVLTEAAEALPHVVFVGHSTGGMYLLSVPELEQSVAGLTLISSAPDAGWRAPFVEMTRQNPLPEVDAASRRFEAEPTDANLAEIAVASAAWNFPARSVDAGREFLRRMPYNHKAVAWSEEHFDDVYSARWWPRTLPTLILSGSEDRIVIQSLWDRPQFQGPNILRRIVPGGHFPWFEAPDQVSAAFRELAARVL